MKKPICYLILLLLLLPVSQSLQGQSGKNQPSWSFIAGDKPGYHLMTLQQQPGKRAVATAAIDGTTACFSLDGKLIWKSPSTGGFPFDLTTGDIDGDGMDEVLVAAGNGSLYAYDHDGRSLWVFERRPPLYQVCIVRNAEDKVTIFTGGVEQVLYALAPDGTVINSMPTEHVIRHLRAGNALGNGRDYLAMATASSGLTPLLKLFLLNPDDLSTVWQRADISVPGMNPGRRFFSMLFTDLDKDGKEELVMGGGWRENGMIHAFNDKGETLFSKSDKNIPNIPYRMSLLRKISVTGDDYILGHFGDVLIIYETDGSLRELIRGPYAFAGSWFDPETKTLLMGSEVSGGTEIYAYRLDLPGWKEAFSTQQPAGRLKEMEDNIALLRKQIRDFTPPSYQPLPKKTLAITRIAGEVAGQFTHVEFARNISLSQKIDNPDELWCREREFRMQYQNTAAELVKIIQEKESAGENVIVWAGHGNAIFFPLSTFESLIKAGPEHLKGFAFAEMEGTGELTRQVVEEIILPLAELCLRHGKIILLRNKNIFWNGTCYLPFWKNVLLNEKYKEVFVPGLEESNSRSQELSLAGRVGLWQSDFFTRWACATITDNVNFDRMFEWGGQQLMTHHLRNLVSTASMGASVHFNEMQSNNYSGNLKFVAAAEDINREIEPNTNPREPYAQLMPYYEMLEKGILQIPDRNNLLSCSDFALVMKSPPSATYLSHGINGHRYNYPATPEPVMVFNKLDTYWGGSITDDWDFSRYAMNVKYRTCNFIPELPYGLVPIVPEGVAENSRFRNTALTDGEFFYDQSGARLTAPEYWMNVEAAIKDASTRLPVRVEGAAHWSVIKLDDKHLRLVLIDPGYLDPASREVKILFQHVKPKSCRDILSGEALKFKGNTLDVVIPAGIFRIIDVELRKKLP
jgi:hypothetical protein